MIYRRADNYNEEVHIKAQKGGDDIIGVNFKQTTFMAILFSLFRLKLCVSNILKDRQRKMQGRRVRIALNENRIIGNADPASGSVDDNDNYNNNNNNNAAIIETTNIPV